MPKPASNLSEAFLNVREYLWDGSAQDTRNSMICFATTEARKAGAITSNHSTCIKDIIQRRLCGYTGVHSYLRYGQGVPTTALCAKTVQDYRHAWLIELSNEFAKQS